MASRDGGRELLTGGGDGAVRVWEAAALAAAAERAEVSGGGGAVEVAARGELRFGEARKRGGSGGVCARALAAVPGGDVLVGTSECDVVMLGGGGERRVLVDGHTADLYGVARSAASAELFATACDSSRLKLWDAVARRALCEVPVGAAARCVAFSADGVWLAAGLVDGTVEVLRAAVAARRWRRRVRRGARGRPRGERAGVLARRWDAGGGYGGGRGGAVRHGDVAAARAVHGPRDDGGARRLVARLDHGADQLPRLRDPLLGGSERPAAARRAARLGGVGRVELRARLAGDGYLARRLRRHRHQRGARVDDGRLLVAADDRGGVLLYRFVRGVARRAAAWRALVARDERALLAGGDRCVSVGGRDRAVVQWRLVRPTPLRPRTRRPLSPSRPPRSPSHRPRRPAARLRGSVEAAVLQRTPRYDAPRYLAKLFRLQQRAAPAAQPVGPSTGRVRSRRCRCC